MMGEIWKPVVGYEDRYLVSDIGSIKLLSSKTIMPKGGVRINKGGVINQYLKFKYPIVHLYKDGIYTTFRVHRLVCKAFLDNPLGKRTVNHKDGNPQNNKLENLEWATYSENINHAYKMGLNKGPVGVAQPRRGDSKFSKEVGQYSLSMKLIKIHDCLESAGDEVGVTPQAIWYAIKHKSGSLGYYWTRYQSQLP